MVPSYTLKVGSKHWGYSLSLDVSNVNIIRLIMVILFILKKKNFGFFFIWDTYMWSRRHACTTIFIVFLINLCFCIFNKLFFVLFLITIFCSFSTIFIFMESRINSLIFSMFSLESSGLTLFLFNIVVVVMVVDFITFLF